MTRVLVTGGAGFIGSHVAEACVHAGFEVHVLDDLSTGARSNVPVGATLHELDLRESAAVHALVSELRPEVVNHHAAQTSVPKSVRDPVLDAEINVLGSLNLLSAATACGVRRFVFASTGGAIYGEVPEGSRAGFGWPEAPISPYGAAKLAVEHYLASFRRRGLETVTLRYANVHGPRRPPSESFLTEGSQAAPTHVQADPVRRSPPTFRPPPAMTERFPVSRRGDAARGGLGTMRCRWR